RSAVDSEDHLDRGADGVAEDILVWVDDREDLRRRWRRDRDGLLFGRQRLLDDPSAVAIDTKLAARNTGSALKRDIARLLPHIQGRVRNLGVEMLVLAQQIARYLLG